MDNKRGETDSPGSVGIELRVSTYRCFATERINRWCRGCDIVEVAPAYDHADITARFLFFHADNRLTPRDRESQLQISFLISSQ